MGPRPTPALPAGGSNTEAIGKGQSQEPGDRGRKGRLREPVLDVIQLYSAL